VWAAQLKSCLIPFMATISQSGSVNTSVLPIAGPRVRGWEIRERNVGKYGTPPIFSHYWARCVWKPWQEWGVQVRYFRTARPGVAGHVVRIPDVALLTMDSSGCDRRSAACWSSRFSRPTIATPTPERALTTARWEWKRSGSSIQRHGPAACVPERNGSRPRVGEVRERLVCRFLPISQPVGLCLRTVLQQCSPGLIPILDSRYSARRYNSNFCWSRCDAAPKEVLVFGPDGRIEQPERSQPRANRWQSREESSRTSALLELLVQAAIHNLNEPGNDLARTDSAARDPTPRRAATTGYVSPHQRNSNRRV